MNTLATGPGRGRPPRRTDNAPLRHWEVHAMNAQIQYLQAVHADRLARLHSGAAERAPDAVRLPLMQGRPASPITRETLQ